MSAAKILIVEGDAELRSALCEAVQSAGFNSIAFDNKTEALGKLDHPGLRAVVCEAGDDGVGGLAMLRKIRMTHQWLPVILMSTDGRVESAVEAMREGAADYLLKPFPAATLVELLDRIVGQRTPPELGVMARDPLMVALVQLARRVAASEATVLLSGESGTGKEVLSRFIHEASPRARGPFVAVNCAAIPENMLEAMLFGHEKGAFTGAHQAKTGKFELAHKGTLLLDEISEMDLGLQAKLLRVLQEREVERLGGDKPVPVEVRVLATTNRDLKELVRQGEFREDLYYRLNVFPLRVPALRERPVDILPLASLLLSRHCTGGRLPPLLTRQAQLRMLEHSWPGNVRELENLVQRALVLCSGSEIAESDLMFEGESLSTDPAVAGSPALAEPEPDLEQSLRLSETRVILDALKSSRGSRKQAAESLGISPRTLRYKLARMKEKGLDLSRYSAVSMAS